MPKLNFSKLIGQLPDLKAAIPDENKSLDIKCKFVDEFLLTLLKGFNLNLEMVSLSQEELEAWDNYFYANYLILQCKQAAVLVSQKTWTEIEDRMLRVIDS